MKTSTFDLMCIIAFSAIMACGQLLFRQTATNLPAGSLANAVRHMLGEPVFYLAVGLYGLSTLLWVWILTRVPLSMAYPVTALAIVFVPLLAVVVFGESTSPRYWLGTGMIAAGVWVMRG